MEDGRSIELSRHNWGFEGVKGHFPSGAINNDRLRVVRDLWNRMMGGWDHVRVEGLYGHEL